MLHSNYPKLITSKVSVTNRFQMMQFDIYPFVNGFPVILITLASNIHMYIDEELMVSVTLTAGKTNGSIVNQLQSVSGDVPQKTLFVSGVQ